RDKAREKAAAAHVEKALQVMGLGGKADGAPVEIDGKTLDGHLREAYVAGAERGGGLKAPPAYRPGDKVKHAGEGHFGEGVVLQHAGSKRDWLFVKFPGDDKKRTPSGAAAGINAGRW